ncbi:hypothetical protein E0L36_15375 [Streptomyces sp. AJS327]|uniref:hypothetical protein n=1 Tax=Streptomyces sp. AJS327 TaxID=2545265 RepID=UPI0015DF0864|nr:hypothetical protein [Streptomyces sp. AJS327]MBA0052234.1 hypothetical protein [Streptomyces sp. AJS327]
MRQPARHALRGALILVWGALLLVASAAPGASGAAPMPVADATAEGPAHSGQARSAHSGQEPQYAHAARHAVAASAHEVRWPTQPLGPAGPPAAGPGAPALLEGRAAVGPRQERAPPRADHSPQAPRGPPAARSS